ncbi:MAG: cupin domain-containing protein [Lapillicoccus sp.]
MKVVKLKGEFVWHSHPETDELFLVVAGTLVIQLRDSEEEHLVTLGPGQLYVVPKGIEHRTVAWAPGAAREGDVSVVLVEPEDTVNTGDAGGPLTAVTEDLTG